MTALKEFRHDLADHLAAGLGAASIKVGAKINPPAVTVQSGDPYVTASTYCDDSILFAATIVSSPGDPQAVADDLDDMIDRIRPLLKTVSPGGHRYGFREVSGFSTYPSGDLDLPAVTVTIGIDRIAP